jgi:hypothetical protein
LAYCANASSKVRRRKGGRVSIVREPSDELLGVAHDGLDVGVGAIKLEDGEFGIVTLAALSGSEGACDLKDPLTTIRGKKAFLREKALHLVFGRGR